VYSGRTGTSPDRNSTTQECSKQNQKGLNNTNYKQGNREGKEMLRNIENRNNKVNSLKTSQVNNFPFQSLTQENSLHSCVVLFLSGLVLYRSISCNLQYVQVKSKLG
jgi:hypothetical protein